MTCRIMDLRHKEVINISDGRRLGFVKDLEINLDTGRITSIILPGMCSILNIFGRYTDLVIEWREIKKIGDDIILVDIKDAS